MRVQGPSATTHEVAVPQGGHPPERACREGSAGAAGSPTPSPAPRSITMTPHRGPDSASIRRPYLQTTTTPLRSGTGTSEGGTETGLGTRRPPARVNPAASEGEPRDGEGPLGQRLGGTASLDQRINALAAHMRKAATTEDSPASRRAQR